MIRWSRLKKLIPPKVKIKNNCYYEVVWVTEFPKDKRQLGETRYDTKQILINTNQSDKETVGTFFHESFHAFGHEYDIGLTEPQIIKLENALYYMLQLFWLFK